MSVRTLASRGNLFSKIAKMEEDETSSVRTMNEDEDSSRQIRNGTLNLSNGDYSKSSVNDMDDGRMEIMSIEEQREQVDAQLKAMAVSGTTTKGSSTKTPKNETNGTSDNANSSQSTRSSGRSRRNVQGNCRFSKHEEGKDRLKPFAKTCTKFNLSGGSGSGDHDGMVSMEDGADITAKKRKTRRGKPKHRKLKPYSKQQSSYQQRLRSRASSGRPSKAGRPQPPAPYNTTQFLIEDHNDLPDLEEKLTTTDAPAIFSKPVPPLARTRDSSFSIDSDEDFFYSSPEDEEEFLTKEFKSAYEDLHAERLASLTKAQLIQEYIQLEAKIDSLSKRLRLKHASQHQDIDKDGEGSKSDLEVAKKVKMYQQRIDELVQQNEALRRENEHLKKRHGSPTSSVDSESDSESTSNSSACSCKSADGSSPVPSSYHARREKTNRSKNNSVSSFDDDVSDNDSTGGTEYGIGTSPRNSTSASSNNILDSSFSTAQQQQIPTATTTQSPSSDISNGHATANELVGLPTT